MDVPTSLQCPDIVRESLTNLPDFAYWDELFPVCYKDSIESSCSSFNNAEVPVDDG